MKTISEAELKKFLENSELALQVGQEGWGIDDLVEKDLKVLMKLFKSGQAQALEWVESILGKDENSSTYSEVQAWEEGRNELRKNFRQLIKQRKLM